MPGPVRNALSDIGEAIVKPVVDEGAKILEVGGQSIAGSNTTPVDPQEEAQKKADEELKKRNINTFLGQLSANEMRSQQLQTQAQQRKIEASQKVAEEKRIDQFEVKEKNDSLAQTMARTAIERKPGQSGG